MAIWQVETVEQLDEYSYSVTYLLNGRKRAKAIIHPTFGLDKAINAMGDFLAGLPEFNGAPIGGH